MKRTSFSINKGKTEAELFDGWKKGLDAGKFNATEISQIEARCKVLMKIFGYKRDVLLNQNISSAEKNWSPTDRRIVTVNS